MVGDGLIIHHITIVHTIRHGTTIMVMATWDIIVRIIRIIIHIITEITIVAMLDMAGIQEAVRCRRELAERYPAAEEAIVITEGETLQCRQGPVDRVT